MKYFDIVYYDLFEKNKSKDLEEIFTKLSLKKIYVLKNISSKNDLKEVKLPEFKNIKLELIYKTDNLNLLREIKSNVIFSPKDFSSKLTKCLINKNINYLYSPLSSTLCFDEQCANLCKQNNIKILFNYNYLRNKFANKNIKQIKFIIPLIKNKLIDFYFFSFAKEICDLSSKEIIFNFLKEFDMDENFLNKIFNHSNFKE